MLFLQGERDRIDFFDFAFYYNHILELESMKIDA